MSQQSNYMPRIADSGLRERLGRVGAVVIEGAKGCGKTETSAQRAASVVRFDLDTALRQTAEIAPMNVLMGAAPQLLDEWQLVPGLWNAVRRAVDDRGLDGQFILTGSATPSDDETRHSGAGRFSRMRLRTLTLAESGLSTAQVSLSALLEGHLVDGGHSELTVNDLIEETCHGGWPRDRSRSWSAAQRNVADYMAEMAHADVRLEGAPRDPARVMAVLRALARNTAGTARVTTLAADASTETSLSDATARSYLTALQRLMVLEPLTSWSPVLRDKARLRKAVKYHFIDPAVSASLLQAGPDELRLDLKTYGFLFESLVVRDLRVYAEAARAAVYHYRDSSGLEVDAIVDGGYGRWAAFEVKLGGSATVIDRAAANLLRFAAQVDTQSSGAPRLLAVITAEGYAHTRPDGIAVIPLPTLGP
ncbi:MAG: DUF4143 domain-containing protein [Propionibacteriaceae bacterium]|jgi:predicted AAA+ superfamily ATPase|nr:DUF4143 domain-containing protein [Propionibacteriaceae bacterium]